MEEYLIGTICAFGFNKLPENFLPCDGNLVSSDTYGDLHAVIGETFGGEHPYFRVPDLRGRIAISPGQQTGGTTYEIAMVAGTETVTLNSANLPAHNHAVVSASMPVGGDATTSVPTGAYMATANDKTGNIYASAQTGTTTMGRTITNSEPAGKGMTVDTLVPYAAVNYCICYKGTIPTRVH